MDNSRSDGGSSAGQSAAQGSIALAAAFVVTAALNYGFAILMSWLLPVGHYGMLGVAQTVMALGGTVVSAGFPWALTRSIARQPGFGECADLVRTALLANLIIGVGLGGLLYTATTLGWLPFGAEYGTPILLASVTIAALAVYGVFAAALQGFLRFSALGVVYVVEVIGKFVCGVALVWLGAGAAGAVAGFLVGALLASVLAAVCLRDLQFWRKQAPTDRKAYADVGPFFLGTLSLALLVNFDIIGLNFFSVPARSNELTGQYQAAVTLARVPIFVALALLNAVFPYLSRHPARSATARTYATLALKYTLLFIVPLDLIFVVRAAAVLRIFYAPIYSVSARPLMVAAIGTIMLTLIQAATMLLQAAGRLRVTVLVLLGAAALEFASSWWLVPRLEAVGAALALVTAATFGLGALLPALGRTYQLIPSRTASVRYGLAVATFALALWLLPHGGRTTTVMAIVLAGVGYILMLVLLRLFTADDVDLLGGSLGLRFSAWVHRIRVLVARLNLASPAIPDPYAVRKTEEVPTDEARERAVKIAGPGREVVSVVIPSWTGDVIQSRRSLEMQTFRDYALYVVARVSPAGRARNLGVAASDGEFVLFLDDDAYFGHERVLELLVATLQMDPTIGVAGPSKLMPPAVTFIQRCVAAEVPRWVYPVVDHPTESNPPLHGYGFTGITTTCAIMRRATFDAVGGFDEELPTGPEDTDFFYRARRLGFRFVIPAACWVYHAPPHNLAKLLRKGFQYGVGHAMETRKAPGRHMAIVPLDRWQGKLLVLLSPLLFLPCLFLSVYLDPARQWRFGFRPLKALSTYATFYGYTWGWFRGLPRTIKVRRDAVRDSGLDVHQGQTQQESIPG